MDTKAAIARVKELAEQNRYREARAILEKIDHPLKESWLAKMDALIAKQKRAQAAQPPAPKSTTTAPKVAAEKPVTPPTRTTTTAAILQAAKKTTSTSPKIDVPAKKATTTVSKVDVPAKKATTTAPQVDMPAKKSTQSVPPLRTAEQATMWGTPSFAPSGDEAEQEQSEPAPPAPPKFPDMAIATGLVTILVAGIIVGILLFASSKITYLIILSPAIAAAALGGILLYTFKEMKVRQPILAAVFGVLIGLVGYTSFRYAEYLDFRQAIREEILTEYSDQVNTENVDDVIAGFLYNETGQVGFVGFVLLEAKEGMSVSSTTSYSDETPWSPAATIIYWLVEILIMTGVPATMLYQMANQPFCEDTGEWLKFFTVAGVSSKHRNQFLSLMRAHRFAEAAALIKDDRVMGAVRIQIAVGRCHDQATEGMIRVREPQGRYNTMRDILKANLNIQEYAAFLSALRT